MKITKTSLSVFLVTFLIGYFLIVPPRKNVVPIVTTNSESPILLTPLAEAENEFEIIEKVDDSVDNSELSFKMKILETGDDYSEDEVAAKNGEIWLGLFKEKDNYQLRLTKMKISLIPNTEKDDLSSEMKKSVKVGGANKPLFLLKNFNTSKEKSRITTLFQGMTWSDILEHKNRPNFDSYEMLTKLDKNFTSNYKIGGNGYTLKVIEAKNKDNAEILALVLEGGGKRQIIHTVSPKESADVGYLYWVGDLDSDGKPDFYMSLYENDNISARSLFLSSKAEEGKLIKVVASFVSYADC